MSFERCPTTVINSCGGIAGESCRRISWTCWRSSWRTEGRSLRWHLLWHIHSARSRTWIAGCCLERAWWWTVYHRISGIGQAAGWFRGRWWSGCACQWHAQSHTGYSWSILRSGTPSGTGSASPRPACHCIPIPQLSLSYSNLFCANIGFVPLNSFATDKMAFFASNCAKCLHFHEYKQCPSYCKEDESQADYLLYGESCIK